MKYILIIILVAILAGCVGIGHKSVTLDECITDILDRDDELRKITSELDSIAEDLVEFLTTSGDELSDEKYEQLYACQQTISVQASIFSAEATRITLEEMDKDVRVLRSMYDSFLSDRIRRCLP